MQRPGSETSSTRDTSQRAMLTPVQLSMFGLANWRDIPSTISLPASADGPMPCAWQDGQTIDQSGPGVAPASPFPLPDNAGPGPTPDTCGQTSSASSASAVLQSSLENRLRARTDVNGSPEYVLTWKAWPMRLGPPICALRAQARHTLGNGCIGWPTLIKRDGATLLRARRAPNATGSEPMAWVGGLVTGIVTENRAGLKMEVSVGLNPAWASWLMGFPAEWPQSAPLVTRSSRKSPPNSSVPR